MTDLEELVMGSRHLSDVVAALDHDDGSNAPQLLRRRREAITKLCGILLRLELGFLNEVLRAGEGRTN